MVNCILCRKYIKKTDRVKLICMHSYHKSCLAFWMDIVHKKRKKCAQCKLFIIIDPESDSENEEFREIRIIKKQQKRKNFRKNK